jgi:hypothetical protein
LKKRLLVIIAVVVVAVLGIAWVRLIREPFPSEQLPEGSYARIALAIGEDRVNGVFPYLETEAQWACFTIKDTRSKAAALVKKSYPEPQKTELLATYREEADAPDGADVFALMARRRGWIARLRKDLSGVKKTEVEGERATIVTARGTRYPMRRRDNGIWGLTIFTAELVAEAERATRDLAVVQAAAADYERARP